MWIAPAAVMPRRRLEGTGLDPCRPRHEERAAPSPSGDAHPLERDTAQVVEQHLEAVYREPVRRTLRIGLPSGIRRRFGLPARRAVRRLPWYPVGPVPRYGRDGSHGRTSFSSAAARYWSRISASARCPTVGVSIGEMAWNDSLSPLSREIQPVLGCHLFPGGTERFRKLPLAPAIIDGSDRRKSRAPRPRRRRS